MKNLMFLAVLFAGTVVSAQDKTTEQPLDAKLAYLDIRTSTVCDMCEKTIEEGLIYEKGVKKVDVDLEKSLIHVAYNPKKNDPDRLRKAVSLMGYMADDIPGDEAAFKKLPDCCQKEGCGKPVAKP